MDRDRDPSREGDDPARDAISARRKPGLPPHEPPPGERPESDVDVGSQESMPASDPPAHGGGPAAGD